MSLAATSYVLHRTFGNQTRKLLMIAIADFANDAGEAYPSIDTLASRAECSRRSVQEHLVLLEKSGELAIAANAGPRGTNLYRILFRKNDAPAPSTQGVQELHGGVRDLRGGVQMSDAQTARGGANERRPFAPESSGTVRELSGREEERASAPEPTPPSDPVSTKLPALPSAKHDVLFPGDRHSANLAAVWPEAPRHMSGSDLHSLHSALRVLDELSAEDWIACTAYVQAPRRVRGCALWPRSRSEFVANIGEAAEKIRRWWHHEGGKHWWTAKSVDAVTGTKPATLIVGIDPGEPGGDFGSKAEAVDFFRELKSQKQPANA
jgi:hypothetical protein